MKITSQTNKQVKNDEAAQMVNDSVLARTISEVEERRRATKKTVEIDVKTILNPEQNPRVFNDFTTPTDMGDTLVGN